MLIAISIMILAYMIMGKDITPLLNRVRNVDWRGNINAFISVPLKSGQININQTIPEKGKN